MPDHICVSGVTRHSASAEVETRVHVCPLFMDVWEDWFGKKRSEPVAELAGDVAAFMCSAGGAPAARDNILQINLLTDSRMTKKPFRGDYCLSVINVWITPHKNNPSWGVPRFYHRRPLLPSYAVRNPREALVAAVAHECSHWLKLGRDPHRYWSDAQAMEGTEFVCETMAMVALEVFCPVRHNRFKAI